MLKTTKISDNHEYVLDTSIIMASILRYSKEMRKLNPQSNEDYDQIHEVCFVVLSELIRAKIAIDKNKIIQSEYESEVFDKYPNDFPAQWYTMMESRGKIVPKRIEWRKKCSIEMHRRFRLSKVDCCLIHVAEKTSSKTVLHRDKGISNAAGYIKKTFCVNQINVMKSD